MITSEDRSLERMVGVFLAIAMWVICEGLLESRAGAQGIICGDYVFPTALPTPAHVCSPRDPGYCDWGGICTVVQNSDFTRVACAFASAANVCAARNFDGRHGTAYYQNQRKACNIQCEAVRGYYFYLPYVAFSR